MSQSLLSPSPRAKRDLSSPTSVGPDVRSARELASEPSGALPRAAPPPGEGAPPQVGEPQVTGGALRARAPAAQALLEAGAEWSPRGRAPTPLHDAASQGIDVALDVLLEFGANPDCRLAPYGEAPLHGAAAEGRLGAIRRLAASGADVDAPDRVGEPWGFNVTSTCEFSDVSRKGSTLRELDEGRALVQNSESTGTLS